MPDYHFDSMRHKYEVNTDPVKPKHFLNGHPICKTQRSKSLLDQCASSVVNAIYDSDVTLLSYLTSTGSPDGKIYLFTPLNLLY